MARLTIETVTKDFGSFKALDRVSLDAADGEFIAVLGPSGCGKTTLLRLIAGFDEVASGTIRIGETVVSSPAGHVATELRRVGIVFQNYALWPHMTVAENVGYSLRVAGVATAERNRRVEEALMLVDLGGFGDRRPANLSGGQRQRVALARCLVAAPSLVLLDEPLANLDVHLRAAMEDEFAAFHRRTGNTMIYITHDQAEAMALADRIAVMDHGRLLQLATPSELFREPANAMVASFIGHGMVLPLTDILPEGDGRARARLFGRELTLRCARDQRAARQGDLCVRAGDLTLAGADGDGLACRVTRVVYRGGLFRLEAVVEAEGGPTLSLDVPEPTSVEVGDAVTIAVKPGRGWAIPTAGGRDAS
ncbi:ABC transporter ATP-binding protein [Chelatococcus asaccharovorans]|uniref:ABC transporter ATP-binding protein n=1 Tax=Chelatococcus asaccharovorans TaxID=28210 RepID=UPI00224C6346|nr:ABC transporter ATP-binding protein [Chelatococcus asaccharovorans]CAH1668415.1 sn-glycerol-3-phosphate import ATP-binding protein UgpC 2 [Chelatococcus asaccharovorans]CAH1680114.1 sn-glycerol-3-phosphate import ATP-binding protein UgpC 2 [Chelatococcus asaccharovorans]